MAAQSASCNGWDVFTGIFSTVWNGVAGAAGVGAFNGLAPSGACAPQNVYVREHINDQRAGYGLVITIATVTVVVFALWGALKIYKALK